MGIWKDRSGALEMVLATRWMVTIRSYIIDHLRLPLVLFSFAPFPDTVTPVLLTVGLRSKSYAIFLYLFIHIGNGVTAFRTCSRGERSMSLLMADAD